VAHLNYTDTASVNMVSVCRICVKDRDRVNARISSGWQPITPRL